MSFSVSIKKETKKSEFLTGHFVINPNNDTVIMVTADTDPLDQQCFCGVVIFCENTMHKIGARSRTWDRKLFIDFEGEITIKQS